MAPGGGSGDFVIRIRPVIDDSDLIRKQREMESRAARAGGTGAASTSGAVPLLPYQAVVAPAQTGSGTLIAQQQGQLAALRQQQLSVIAQQTGGIAPSVRQFQRDALAKFKSQVQGFDLLPVGQQRALARSFNQAFQTRLSQLVEKLGNVPLDRLTTRFNRLANAQLRELGLGRSERVTPAALLDEAKRRQGIALAALSQAEAPGRRPLRSVEEAQRIRAENQARERREAELRRQQAAEAKRKREEDAAQTKRERDRQRQAAIADREGERQAAAALRDRERQARAEQRAQATRDRQERAAYGQVRADQAAQSKRAAQENAIWEKHERDRTARQERERRKAEAAGRREYQSYVDTDRDAAQRAVQVQQRRQRIAEIIDNDPILAAQRTQDAVDARRTRRQRRRDEDLAALRAGEPELIPRTRLKRIQDEMAALQSMAILASGGGRVAPGVSADELARQRVEKAVNDRVRRLQERDAADRRLIETGHADAVPLTRRRRIYADIESEYFALTGQGPRAGVASRRRRLADAIDAYERSLLGVSPVVDSGDAARVRQQIARTEAQLNAWMEAKVAETRLMATATGTGGLARGGRGGIFVAPGAQYATNAQMAAINRNLAALSSGGAAGGGGGGRGGYVSPIPPSTPPPGGGGFLHRLRYSDQDTLGGFFAHGALSSIKYGLPSMLMYGMASGITNAVREAEEFQYNLARIETQFNATFGSGASEKFASFKQEILDIARETGIAADEMAALGLQITGAFGRGVDIDGLQGLDLVKEQSRAAAQIAQVTKLPLNEITDGLTAASLAFNRSFRDIGNVALSLEAESGVLAKETISFIGDIAPVAQEAGYSMEEFSAIAAVAQQRSGRSGAALAESFGRVIPAISENKDKLFELAAANEALGTPEFIDAIRTSDSKAILDRIAESFDGLNRESQQFVITLLGGRREAQALIPALANKDLINELTRAAENSAGTLQDRFNAIRKTLTNTLQRLGESLRQLTVNLMEAGLHDLFQLILAAASALLKVFNSVLGVVADINQLFGGMPAKVLLIAAAWRFLSGGTAAQLPFLGAGIGYAQGTIRGAPLIVREAAGRVTAPGSAFAVARATRQDALLNPNTGRLAAAAAGARAGAGALLGAVSAGTWAFLGITALTAAYGFVNSKVDEANADLDRLNDETRQGNQKALEVGTRTARLRRYRNLQDAADFAENERSWWDRFWRTVTNTNSEAEELRLAASELLIDPDVAEKFSNLNETPRLQKRLSRLALPTPGRRNIGNLRQLVRDMGSGQFERNEEGVYGVKQGPAFEAFNDREQEFFAEVQELTGVKNVENLSPEVVEALLNKRNPLRALMRLLNRTDDAKVRTQIQNILSEIDRKGKTDDEINTILKAANPELNLSPLQRNERSIEQLRKEFKLGAISETEYFRELRKFVERRRDMLRQGKEDPGRDERLETLELLVEQRKEYAQAVAGRQERDQKIAEAYGAGSGTLAQLRMTQAERNLKDPSFNDPEAVTNAALDYIKYRQEYYEYLADQTDDVNEAVRLLNEGRQVPAFVRAQLMSVQVQETEGFQRAADTYQKLRNNAKNAKIRNAGIVDPELGPAGLLDRVINETLQGGVTPETARLLTEGITDVQTRLNDTSQNWTSTERGALANILDFLTVLANFAGVSSAEIKAIDESIKNDPLVSRYGKPEEDKDIYGIKAAAEEREKKEEEDRAKRLRAARYEALRLDAGSDVEVAELNVQEAFEEALRARASAGEDSAEYAEAQNKLKAAQKALDDAVLNKTKAIINLAKAIAESNNDSVAAAVADVQAAQAELAAATTEEERLEAQANLIRANAVLRDSRRDRILKQMELTKARGSRDPLEQALVDQAIALTRLNLSTGDERPDAEIAYLNAQQAVRDAQNARIEAMINFAKVLEGEDPVKAAQRDLQLAQHQLAVAQQAGNVQAQIEAMGAIVDAQRNLDKAMNDVRYSMLELRQAELDAMGDSIGSAQVAAQLARQQLADAISRGAAQAEINRLKIGVINADKAARDALFSERQDEYRFLYEMGQITKSQYINYLEGLKSTLIPGTKQFRDLELAIKNLKDDIQGGLQMNLPTSLALPTLYEVRRLSQTGGAVVGGGEAGGSIGYQDNRLVNINVNVSNGMGANEVVNAIGQALDKGRTGYEPRRY